MEEDHAAREMNAMKMLGGEFRWLKMNKEQDQFEILVEERKL